MSKLNKIVNNEMLNKIVNSINEETIIDFYTERTYENEYVSILKQIDNYIFENLDLFEKEVENFEDFVENEDNYFENESFEFEFINSRQEVCFYINKFDLSEKLLDLYTNIN